MNKKGYKLRERISETLELPKDIILNFPKITIIGTAQISIENHKGIIEYDDKLIRINTGSGILKINGDHLCIKSIIQEEIVITGEISGVSF